MRRIRPPSADVLEQIRYAAPPGRVPRGYFDPLVSATKQLLDKGLRLHQAADFLIEHRVLRQPLRQSYLDAMRSRLSRLQQVRIKEGMQSFQWMASLYYDASHITAPGERRALCGATANAWEPERSDANRCSRCLGIARRNAIVTV